MVTQDSILSAACMSVVGPGCVKTPTSNFRCAFSHSLGHFQTSSRECSMSASPPTTAALEQKCSPTFRTGEQERKMPCSDTY